MITRWFTNFRIFLVWLISFVLAFAILSLGHEVLMSFIVQTLQWDRYDARFYHLLYYALAGAAWLLFFLLILEYFKNQANKGRLFYGAMKTIGTELAAIAVMQIILMLYGYLPMDWLNFGLILISGGLSTGMLLLNRRKNDTDKEQS